MNDEEKILEFILDKEVSFYTDKQNITSVYVEYKNAYGFLVFEPIDSEMFQSFLSCRFRKIKGKKILPNFQNLLEIYKDDAIFYQKNSVKIHQRLCGSIKKGRIAYNLADRERNVVLIKTANWKCVNNNII